MVDAAAVLAGGACTAVGVLFGRFLPARRRLPKSPRAVCGCEHHYAMHKRGEDGTPGACQALEEEFDYRDANGKYVEHGLVQCTCPGYYGPEPLPEYIPRELSG